MLKTSGFLRVVLGFRLCSARLQAGTRLNLQCPPEGGRYISDLILCCHKRLSLRYSRTASSSVSEKISSCFTLSYEKEISRARRAMVCN